MLRKQWVGECTHCPTHLPLSPIFGVRSWVAENRFRRLETPHFGRRDAERSRAHSEEC